METALRAPHIEDVDHFQTHQAYQLVHHMLAVHLHAGYSNYDYL